MIPHASLFFSRNIRWQHRARSFSNSPLMGRWKTDKTQSEMTDHIDFANVDHCGSEQCVAPPKPKQPKKEKEDDDEEDFYWPFLL